MIADYINTVVKELSFKIYCLKQGRNEMQLIRISYNSKTNNIKKAAIPF